MWTPVASLLLAGIAYAAVINQAPHEARGLLTPNPAYTLVTASVGGPHGDPFDDLHYVDAANGKKRIKSVIMGPCNDRDHVTYMGITFADAAGKHEETVHHGKLPLHAPIMSLDLSDRQHRIYRVQLTTWKQKVGAKRKTRIGYISLVSNNGNIDCGANLWGEKVTSWQAPFGSSLSHFSGSSGDAIDNLQAYFISNRDY